MCKVVVLYKQNESAILWKTFREKQHFIKEISNMGEQNNGAYKVAFGNDAVIKERKCA